jgi:hypothetical protein
VRYDKILVHWSEDFGGYHVLSIDLGPEDQDDPRIKAIVALWREKEKARADNGNADKADQLPMF